MLNVSSSRRIFMCRAPTDMRRGIDRLVSTVIADFHEDPRAGDCFVFIGRDRRRLKVVVWDDGGYWLCSKRLEAGTFALPEGAGATVIVSPAPMCLLLAGIDVKSARSRKRIAHSSADSRGTMAVRRMSGNISVL
jgi:transposase